MYAKFVGEDAGFDNLHADIIAVNAFDNSSQTIVDVGEFAIPVPERKAYLLGEFGHILPQAQGQWSLVQQYAGGCFIEYNNVWWKGEGQNKFGVVDEYRFPNTERFDFVKSIYG